MSGSSKSERSLVVLTQVHFFGGKNMEPEETRPLAKSRAATYLTVAVSIVLSYTLLRGLNWQSGAQFHTVMETVSTLLAFVVGAMALVRFHVKKSNGFLFIGVGFLGTAFLGICRSQSSYSAGATKSDMRRCPTIWDISTTTTARSRSLQTSRSRNN